MEKSPEAFRTISEVADWLGVPTHVLRFWESRFSQIKPVKRAGGRRYYRPTDMALIGGIKRLLHDDGMTIRGAQKLLREKGVRHVASLSQPLDGSPVEDETVIDGTAVELPAGGSAQQEPVAAEPDHVEAPAAVDDEEDLPQDTAEESAPAAQTFADIPEASANDPEDDDEAFPALPGFAARLRLADRTLLMARANALRTVQDRLPADAGR